MARGGFIGSLGLLVLLCYVGRSTQQSQDKSGAPRSSFQSELEERSAQAAANALAQSHVVGHPAPITTPWPIWPTTPYYPPYTTPAPTPPPRDQCLYPDQVIYERDVYDDCQVCVCVQRYPYNYLEKVCGRCSQCPPPIPPTPPPPPPPPPPPTTTPTPPPPPPPPPKCEPFPTNQWFQNPIDPCQLCLCSQANALEIPVIECRPNPQCVHPSTTPPPGPPPPDPAGICDKYPPNIFFPHPTYPCYICKCEQWPYKPMNLECAPNPACEPTPPPPPPPPPTTTIAPTPPPEPPTPWVDPLPGPGPHPSCRPFVPNQIFQHPWDPCLACVCTESQVGPIINVQVNCFTKAECCIIPPGPEPTTPYYPPIPTSTYYPIIRPHNGQIGSSANANAVVVGGDGSVGIPLSPGNSLAQADAAAEAAAQAQAAAEAVQANYINQYPYIQPSQVGSAQAQALAQAQANQALAQALSEANAGASRGYYNPNRISPGGYANANANALVNSLYQQPSYYPGIAGGQAQADSNAQAGWGSANAQADALAQGNAQAQADAQAQSNSGYGPSGWSPVQDALAQAQANVQNTLYAVPQQAPISPYGYGGLGSSSLAQAQAEAEAESGRGSAQAAANALAQEMTGQAQAAAQASANSQQLYQSQPNPLYYTAPMGPNNAHPVDLNALRANGEAEAQAQAQAEASANSNRGAEAAAQAQASASAAALKSADSDAEADSQY